MTNSLRVGVGALLLIAVSSPASRSGGQVPSRGSPSKNVAPEFALTEDADFSLQPNVQWQTMSSRILRVTADRRGRLWYQLRPTSLAPTLDQARKLIAREFDAAQPQLSWIRPLLFEPSGRIWFLYNGNASAEGSRDAYFLGYDGKKFVERPVPLEDGYGSGAVLNGQFDISRSVAQVNGVCFFATPNSVIMYDGSSWSTREFDINPDENSTMEAASQPVNLFPEHDGKGLVVAARSIGNLWRWRDAKWTPVHFSGGREVGRARYMGTHRVAWGVAPVEKGVWAFQFPDVRFIPWDNKALTTAELIAQLDSDKYAERGAATRQLTDLGKPALGALTTALAESSDEETKSRLQNIIDQVNNELPTRVTTPFGPFSLMIPCFLTTLPDGSIIVGAEAVLGIKGMPATTLPGGAGAVADEDEGGTTKAGGVLRMDAEGHVSLLGGNDLLEAFRGKSAFHSGSDDPPTYIPGSDDAWVMGSRSSPAPAMINWRTGAVISTGINEPVQFIAALAADGRVIFRSNHGYVAYDRTAPDTRVALPVVSSMESRICIETGDGTVWGVDAQGTLLHFDGQAMRGIGPAGKITELTDLTSGYDSVVFASDGVWHVISPKVSASSENLEDLIAAHPDLFAHFQTPIGIDPWEFQNIMRIEADRTGNIWLLNVRKQELKVFAGGKWIDGGEALIGAGVGTGRVSVLSPIGDGSHVYVGNGRNYRNAANSDSFLACVKEGQIELAPTLGGWIGSPPNITSPEHGLWIVNRGAVGRGSTVSLLTQAGVQQTVADFAPLACDISGDLWGQAVVPRSEMGNPALRGYTIIRGADRLLIPTALTPLALGPIFPCANGHIYVRTDFGLGELAKPSTAASTMPADLNGIARTYRLPGLPSEARLTGVARSRNLAYFQNGTSVVRYEDGFIMPETGRTTTFFVALPPQ